MRRIEARLSPEREEKLTELFNFYGVTGETKTEQVCNFLDKLYEKLILYKKSQAENSPESEKPDSMEAISCKLRILVDSKYFCVNRPPKATNLLSLEICKVCKALFYGLPNKTKIERESEREQTPTPAEPQEEWQPVEGYEKQIGLSRADGTMFCPFKDVFQYPRECKETCKVAFRSRYEACLRLRRSHFSQV